jgi:adhesin HecA-like repeat protein
MPIQHEHTRYNKVISGEIQGSVTAAQMPDVSGRALTFRAALDNDGNVYIGGAGVTIPDGTTDTTSGIPLDAGDWYQFAPISNLNVFYYICDNTGDDLLYNILV